MDESSAPVPRPDLAVSFTEPRRDAPSVTQSRSSRWTVLRFSKMPSRWTAGCVATAYYIPPWLKSRQLKSRQR
jgi:hypothetical protein